MKLSKKQNYTIAGLSGLLAGGVFSFGFSSYLLPVFVAPYFYLLVYKAKRLHDFVAFTIIFFITFYSAVLGWFIDVDMSAISGIGNRYSSLLLTLCLLLMAGVLTIASLPLGLIAYKLRNYLKKPGFVPLIVISASWVVVEWLRSWAFAVFLYAPEATIGDYWNFGSLGLGVISSPIGYASRIVGMYGLSFLVAGLSLTLVWALKKQYRPLVLTLVLIASLGPVGYATSGSRNQHPPMAASVFQQSIESNKTGNYIDNYAPIKYKSDKPKDLIILHEYSETFLPHKKPFADKYITDRLSDKGISIDVSADFNKPADRFNLLEVRNKQAKLIDKQTKGLLIPTGEYMPSVLQKFFNLTGNGHINDSFFRTRRLEKGEPPRVVKTEGFVVAPVACSGILGRNIYRQLVNDGGQVLTNSASLLIFNGSKSYLKQSHQMARFHAIANNRTYIQSSKGAPAFVVDNNGYYLVAPEDNETSFIDFDFEPKSTKTIYTRIGEWVLVSSWIIVAIFLLRNRLPLLKYHL